MASYIFDEIIERAVKSGHAVGRSRASREWFRKVAQSTQVNPNSLVERNQKMQRDEPRIGKMYAFFYDPKTKKSLPYYDKFPVIFLFDSAPKGFYGMNVHYLPPKLRAKMMDALWPHTSNQKLNERTRMMLNYKTMSSAAKFKLFKPTIKRYLTSHVRSKLIEIPADKWEIAAFLPTARFAKASKAKVWNDSTEMVG